MPSTYAHRYFGERVRSELPDALRRVIDSNRELFDVGLHGPDILFYHKPLFHNKVNRLGHRMHTEAGTRFFTEVTPDVKNSKDEEGALSYILGFICHFTLDSACHPCVRMTMKQTNVPHVEIETEFDKALMAGHGLDPWDFDTTDHMITGRRTSEIIGSLLKITSKDAEIAVRDMKKYCRFFTTESKAARKVIFPMLKISGLEKNVRGMFLNRKDHPLCAESNEELTRLMEKAVTTGAELIESYMQYYEHGIPLHRRFERKYE